MPRSQALGDFFFRVSTQSGTCSPGASVQEWLPDRGALGARRRPWGVGGPAALGGMLLGWRRTLSCLCWGRCICCFWEGFPRGGRPRAAAQGAAVSAQGRLGWRPRCSGVVAGGAVLPSCRGRPWAVALRAQPPVLSASFPPGTEACQPCMLRVTWTRSESRVVEGVMLFLCGPRLECMSQGHGIVQKEN